MTCLLSPAVGDFEMKSFWDEWGRGKEGNGERGGKGGEGGRERGLLIVSRCLVIVWCGVVPYSRL
jgi:hypothetical protein